jgi:hypothetical protein
VAGRFGWWEGIWEEKGACRIWWRRVQRYHRLCYVERHSEKSSVISSVERYLEEARSQIWGIGHGSVASGYFGGGLMSEGRMCITGGCSWNQQHNQR